MRDYGKVHSAIWSSPDFLEYSDDAKLLVFYLLTSTHTTMTGAFRLPDGYLCADVGWSQERVTKGLGELFAKGFCNRCGTTKWLWICKFLRWNPPENPNQWKAVTKQAAQVPSQCTWKQAFMRYLAKLFSESYPKERNPFETLSKPEAVTEAVTEAGTGTGESPRKRGTRQTRKTPIPKDFEISDAVRKWAEEKGFDQLDEHLEAFVCKAEAKGYRYVNWDRAFQEAVRKDWAGLREEARARNTGTTGTRSSDQFWEAYEAQA